MDKKLLLQLVKPSFVQLPVSELVTKGTDILTGVSAAQAKILAEMKITNLFELGLSDIFQNARFISSITNKAQNVKENFLPEEMITEKKFSDSLDNLKFSGPELLTGVGEKNGKLLEELFGFKTIKDLAGWKPFIAARLLVNDHLGIKSKTESVQADANDDGDGVVNTAVAKVKSDPEAPQDLVPKTGEYPVEVVYYDSVVMIDAPKRNDMKEITGRVKLNYDDTKMGYDTYGFGAILTFKQSWIAEGITLGSLIKSIALAPGESTKIAVIDWQRSTTGTTSEDISQKENLSNTQSQSRAISEIAGATANELQSGSSLTGSVSTSANAGVAGGAFTGGILVGATASTSVNGTEAATVTASAGQRDISSNMQQNIDNSTQQNSFAARNKRSSLVTEVSQSETETITTRTITNYNHMHALTIQYWQVVQAFTTEVKLDRYKRCIFIPMDIINFNDERVISKFNSVLYNAARTQRIRILLSATDYNVSVVQMAKQIFESMEIPAATDQNQAIREEAIEKREADKRHRQGHIVAYGVQKGLVSDFDPDTMKWKMSSSTCLVNADLTLGRGNTDKIDKINILKEDGSVVVITKSGFGANSNRNGLNPGFTEPIPLGSITSISVELKPSPALFAVTIQLLFKLNGNVDGYLPIGFVVPPNTSKTEILKFQAPPKTNELAKLLNEDALYYSQKIWMNMDPNFLSMQLSPYKIPVGKDAKKTVSLTEYIDPKPIAVMGNCLAFIWHDQEDASWLKWKAENINESKRTYQKIALPTDGIFGEAVLGRFNSAEKLDITRFWNWQDSPIPFSAPDIAAIQSGQHQVEGAQRPGILDPSLLSIQSPQALPDPTAMQGILQTLAVTNLFRDMSGVAQTSLLAQGALNASSAGATNAGAQAGTNMTTFANMQVEMAKIVASLAPMLLGLPPGKLPATNTLSGGGAALNAAQAVDARQLAESGDGGGISPAQVIGGSTPKSSNEQKVLEKVTGITPVPAISIPGTVNSASGQQGNSTASVVNDPADNPSPASNTNSIASSLLKRLEKTISEAKQTNDIEKIKLAFKNAESAVKLGFDKTEPAFTEEKVKEALQLSIILNTEFDTSIKEGETRPLLVEVLVKIGNNEALPVSEAAVIIDAIDEAEVIHAADHTGGTDLQGLFKCEIKCIKRPDLMLTVTALGDQFGTWVALKQILP